jgi:hypothetical protein
MRCLLRHGPISLPGWVPPEEAQPWMAQSEAGVVRTNLGVRRPRLWVACLPRRR